MLKLALNHIRCYTVHTNDFFVYRTPLYAWLALLSVCLLFCPYAHLFSVCRTSHAACPCTSSHLILQAYVLTVCFSFLPPLLRTDPVETTSDHIHVSFALHCWRDTTSSAVDLATSVSAGSEAFFDITQRTVLHLGYLPSLTLFRHVFQLPQMLSDLT